ncbi:MAG: SET domain-containing protein-lysine N-methyltransferase [Candidatus Cloacimonetes bacterium]|nr:SET domain-containing protein-lysine N-methyltransferase [Candidatus Cloacimonadota bacterium]
MSESSAFIVIPCFVAPSKIHIGGTGYFVSEPVAPGQFVIAPTNIHQVLKIDELNNLPANLQAASVEWFDEHFVVSNHWDRECYMNHSFEPNCHYHLGFTIAIKPMLAGEEITVDYRFLLMEGYAAEFLDSVTNQPVIGLPFVEKMARSAEILGQIYGRPKLK